MSSLSVVIPTYNRSDLLVRALDSVLSQTYNDFEVIVVDDGSEEDVRSVVGKYDDPRIRFVRHEENQGAAASRNTGIDEATGDYVAFLDSDDEWLPEKLEVQLADLRKSEAGVAYCWHYVYDDTLQRVKIRNGNERTGEVYEDALAGWCPATTSLFVVERGLLEHVGGFAPGIPSFEDYDLWIRLAAITEFIVSERALVIKHEHAGEQISVDPMTRRYGLSNFLNKWRDEIEARHGRETVEEIRREHLAPVLRTEALNHAVAMDRKTSIERWLEYLLVKRSVTPGDVLRLCVLLVGGVHGYERVNSWLIRRRWDLPTIIGK